MKLLVLEVVICLLLLMSCRFISAVSRDLYSKLELASARATDRLANFLAAIGIIMTGFTILHGLCLLVRWVFA